MIEGAFPKAFCLLHYYTTRACRKINVKPLKTFQPMVEEHDCNIQDLFADAFISLQREIKEATARYDPKDPLSLLDDAKTTSFKSKESKDARPKLKFNGGFLPQITETERKLMEQHMKSSVTAEVPNPYKRKKFPTSTIWHQTMNPTYSDAKKFDSLPQQVNTCSCGSDSVVCDGNIIGRNAEGTKAEIWGSKQDADVIDRFRCLTCGNIF